MPNNILGTYNLNVSVTTTERVTDRDFNLNNNTATRTQELILTIDRDDTPVISTPGSILSRESTLSTPNVITGQVTANFGSDGPGMFIIQSTGGFSESGAMKDGVLKFFHQNITVTTQGDTYVGKAGSTTVFTLKVNMNGTYTFTQFHTLDLQSPNNPNEIINLNFDIVAKDADGDFDGGNPSNVLDSVLTLEPTGVEIRFGRAQLENSYGPETSKLPQPLSVNYFNDGQYIVAEDDECTPYNATEMSLTNIDLINFSASTPLPDITLVAGDFKDEIPAGITRAIELTAPGAGNIGQVCVSYAIVPWLQYKWAVDEDNLQCPFVTTDVDGLFNDNPFAIATFGIYRGNDRIIYQREIAK